MSTKKQAETYSAEIVGIEKHKPTRRKGIRQGRQGNKMREFEKQYNGHQIRIAELDGVPWFAAKDICDVLEIRNNREAVSSLPKEEKECHTMTTLGGKQKMILINESGLYTIIIRSRKPEAKVFKSWVTHDVLPVFMTKGRQNMRTQRNAQTIQNFNIINFNFPNHMEAKHA